MLETKVLRPQENSALDHAFIAALSFLKMGYPIAFPTETVYGLGASIFDIRSIDLIFKTKNRPQDNPLIAHISSLEQVSEIAINIPKAFYILAKHFFPGPLTIVLKKHSKVPAVVSAGGDTIAFRMPHHPIAHHLIKFLGEPIVAPSANLSGKPSSTCVEHVLEDFQGKIPFILDGGPCEFGVESTVLSLLDPENPIILRPGSIIKEQIEQVLQKNVSTVSKIGSDNRVTSPGMKYRHYAPKAKVRLFDSNENLLEYIKNTPSTKRLILSQKEFPSSLHLCCKNVYAHFRHADKLNCDEVLILCDSELFLNHALYNRILKASEN